ncbi:MFS transporter [Nocardia carnea]|uniref:MFS transporter n=1 Tax=Nocardia carnea TaxID=37328 RepID=UPI002458F288|nr:MFS transporter [Nocardia carnea]
MASGLSDRLPARSIGRRKTTAFPPEVWIVSITTFLSRSVGFLALFSTVFYTSLGISAAALSLALFAAGFAGVLGSLAGGWAAARFGPTDVLIAGSLLNVPLLLLLGQLTTYPVFAIVVASVSVAVTQSFSGPSSALITGSSYEGNTVTVVAFHRIFLSSGVTVAPIAVAAVGQDHFPLLFTLSALGSLGTAAVLLCERRRLRTSEHRAVTGERRDTERDSEFPAIADGEPDLSRIARLWTIVVVFGTGMAVYVQSTSGIPLAVGETADGAQLYSVLLIVNSVFIILFELPLSTVLAKVRWNYALGLGIFVTGIGLAVCGAGTSWSVCIFGFVVFSLGEAIFIPQASAAIADIATHTENPRFQGYLSAAQAIGFAVGPGIGAFAILHDSALYWTLVIQISFAAGSIAVVAGMHKDRSPVRV